MALSAVSVRAVLLIVFLATELCSVPRVEGGVLVDLKKELEGRIKSTLGVTSPERPDVIDPKLKPPITTTKPSSDSDSSSAVVTTPSSDSPTTGANVTSDQPLKDDVRTAFAVPFNCPEGKRFDTRAQKCYRVE